MPQVDRPICPHSHLQMNLALSPGGKGRRTFQCFDCDRPDPMRSEGGGYKVNCAHLSKVAPSCATAVLRP
jgi:hypothetical protein